MRVNLVLMDPPWMYTNNKSNSPKLGGKTYATLSNEELAAIPLTDILEKDALVFTWWTGPKANAIPFLVEAWGLQFVTMTGFIWVKTSRSGSIYRGLGHYTQQNVEGVAILKHGRGLKRAVKNVSQLVFAPIGRHSSKPVEVHCRLERLYPAALKLEMFARRSQPGWICTGLEHDRRDVRDFVAEFSQAASWDYSLTEPLEPKVVNQALWDLTS